MIFHIVQNGGYMFLILFLCLLLTSSTVQEHAYSIQAFCSGNLYIHSIEPGEPYVLSLRSEPFSTGIGKSYLKSKRICRQEFKTSDSAAHFEVFISNMSIPSCGNCRCNYFEISGLGHKKRYCGNRKEDSFLSKSDTLSIDFHHVSTNKFDVTFTFNVKRNFYLITGTPINNSVSSGYIESPYFPSAYPPNYRAEYILQSNSIDSRVSLLFLDFQISPQSFIEVSGNNGTHLTRFYGNTFRPPAIVSQLNHLSLKFESNDLSGMPGFRALFSFVKSSDLDVPHTDCGNLWTGRANYQNLQPEKSSLYDCVWHITSFPLATKSYLSVSVLIRNISHESNLEFRNGHNSKSKLIKEVNCMAQNCSNLDVETVVPASKDLYIRFNGYLEVSSNLTIFYSTFHTGNCSRKEYKCKNGRCLYMDFRCDGIKQCPDGTDEDMCQSPEIYKHLTTLGPAVHTSLYNGEAYNRLGLVLLLTCSVFMLVFIFVVYRFCKHKDPTIAEQILPQQAGGEMLDIQPTLYPVNSYDCDNPPSYEDFIKASHCYLPLLYTRAKQQFVPKDNCAQCTTSFSMGARGRRHSAGSINVRSSDLGSDIFLSITGDTLRASQPLSSNSYNVEINQHNLSCAFQICDYDVPKLDKPAWWHLDSNINFSKDRRFTLSFIPHRSIGSEILTIVKTRCFSDPCNGISVHCSLY